MQIAPLQKVTGPQMDESVVCVILYTHKNHGALVPFDSGDLIACYLSWSAAGDRADNTKVTTVNPRGLALYASLVNPTGLIGISYDTTCWGRSRAKRWTSCWRTVTSALLSERPSSNLSTCTPGRLGPRSGGVLHQQPSLGWCFSPPFHMYYRPAWAQIWRSMVR